MGTAKLLVVDDQPDDETAKLVAWKDKVDFRVRLPADLEIGDIEFANVVVVDYRLDEPWEERSSISSISLQPLNGLALCAVLRSHEQVSNSGITAFLLQSAHLKDLSPEFPPDSRLHIIAQKNNLEWVFSKTGGTDQQMQQIICISQAIELLPNSWPNDDSAGTKDLLVDWLKMPADEKWTDLAWSDVEECHPPLHELSESKQGLRLVRWMLHSILPYPCLLWTPLRLASRLRVECQSLQNALNRGLRDVFNAALYSGALGNFEGEPRWWGRGIESILWTLTDGQSFDSEATIETLNSKCEGSLVPLSISQPVLCITKDYRFRSEPCDISEAIRVQPDDWPAYAEQAWASIEDVRDEPRLESIIISADRDQMKAEDHAEEGE